MKIPADVPYTGHLTDLTAKITATEPEPVADQWPISFPARPARRGPMAAAMTDHIQNNPFGCSTTDTTELKNQARIDAVLAQTEQ